MDHLSEGLGISFLYNGLSCTSVLLKRKKERGIKNCCHGMSWLVDVYLNSGKLAALAHTHCFLLQLHSAPGCSLFHI